MEVIEYSDCSKKNTKYLTFTNRDGKCWSIPTINSRIALEIYEPSGLKGKIVKYALPYVIWIPITKRFLCGTYVSLVLGQKLNELLTSIFGEEFEYSVFWGTPCIDKKITIQVYRDDKILGYCKVGKSGRISKLFKHEKEILDYLEEKNIVQVPKCLKIDEIDDGYVAFVQSTEKIPGAVVIHSFGELQNKFLCNLWDSTKTQNLYEKTDYYESLKYLSENINNIDKKYKIVIQNAIKNMNDMYCGKVVEWGVCHRDFTPWNTCMVEDKLFVFDFEYALRNAPRGLDRWHFFVQTKMYEEKASIPEIADKIVTSAKIEEKIELVEYLLDIISLYVQRGKEEDLIIANSRAQLLSLVLDKGVSICLD